MNCRNCSLSLFANNVYSLLLFLFAGLLSCLLMYLLINKADATLVIIVFLMIITFVAFLFKMCCGTPNPHYIHREPRIIYTEPRIVLRNPLPILILNPGGHYVLGYSIRQDFIASP